MRHVSGFDDRIAHLLVAVDAHASCFLPFPTALVAEAPDDELTKILYIGTMAIGTVWLALVQVAVVRIRSSRMDEGFPDPAAAWATVGAMLLGARRHPRLARAPATTRSAPALLLARPRRCDGFAGSGAGG